MNKRHVAVEEPLPRGPFFLDPQFLPIGPLLGQNLRQEVVFIFEHCIHSYIRNVVVHIE